MEWGKCNTQSCLQQTWSCVVFLFFSLQRLKTAASWAGCHWQSYSTWMWPAWPSCIRMKQYPYRMPRVLGSSSVCLLWQEGCAKALGCSALRMEEALHTQPSSNCRVDVKLGQWYSTKNHPLNTPKQAGTSVTCCWLTSDCLDRFQQFISQCHFLLLEGWCGSVLSKTWS